MPFGQVPVRGEHPSGRDLHQSCIDLPKTSFANDRGACSQNLIELHRVLFQTKRLPRSWHLLPKQFCSASEKRISKAKEKEYDTWQSVQKFVHYLPAFPVAFDMRRQEI